ncbi:energy transducer TonB [Granulicella arctica]|uniref:Outer membrane biosynthesis protein TonB n=1 Tax=Granulicella arctica TaxID=940613 RepID=A0A7Y9PHK6_9BACT|nr:energy transducer TonB [Granulicella arctica]NYF79278.1 outer membrane biosynthesis protein TonB [Granulicella arctica]
MRYDSSMGRVAIIALLAALGLSTGCAKPPQPPANIVSPLIGLPPIMIDTTRAGLDVREMPSAEMVATTERSVQVAPSVASAMLERRPVRTGFPAGARAKHLSSGHVVFRVIVGRDGVVEGLTAIEASDAVFVPIATASVQSWQYRPYLLNGRAVAMDTTARVDFALGR